MTKRGSRFPTNMSDINWIFSVRMYRYAFYATYFYFVAMKITVFDGSSKPFSSWVLGTFNFQQWFSQELNWSWKRLYVCSFPKTKLAIYFQVAGRSTAHEVEELQAIFILAGDGEGVVKSLCLYCLMVEARLWRLVLEIEWLNCFPSVSLWANCMDSPIRSIYIRLFEQSDCLALLLTNVLACNTVPFCLVLLAALVNWVLHYGVQRVYISPWLELWTNQCPFHIGLWLCFKVIYRKIWKEESGPAMMAAVPSWGLDVNCSGSWSEVEAALAAYWCCRWFMGSSPVLVVVFVGVQSTQDIICRRCLF